MSILVPPDAQITNDFTAEYTEGGEIFMPGENFLIDNGGGVFSL